MASKIFSGLSVIILTIITLACTNNELQNGIGLEQSLVQIPTHYVRLWAQSGATIEFQTQNGVTRQGYEPETLNIPHLTLYHNDVPTKPTQRTLAIEVAGIQVPSSGATISLLIETQNGEPVSAGDRWKRIVVWQETRQIPAHNGAELQTSAVTFTVVFPENISLAGEQIHTPTDYYRYQISVTDGVGATLYTFEQDYAFLLESQWIAALPEVPEASPGAAPDELVIYYCDMIPFQKDIRDPTTWIERQAVHDYVGYELLPKMVAAFRMQSEDWGFLWYPAWTSLRGGRNAERLSVALTDGQTWYHGQAFSRGSSSISINVSGGENYSYGTLTDGLLSTFHHELFHNLQRNLNQHFGGTGWIGGRQDQWQFIAEGTAVLASSVAQPDIQFSSNASERAYFANANLYLGSETIRGDIGRDFSEISPYHAALYWRFLYEHCGGMSAGRENPAAGMQVIRQVLVNFYRTIGGDGQDAAEVEAILPRIMDQAVADSACPFQSYTQSLDAFTRAVDALRFENSRCQEPGLPEGCGFYDPHSLYNNPPDSALAAINGSP